VISVVIPVYNGDEYLDEVLTAVTSQVIDEPFEVLAIDSGSTDRSLEIIRSHPGVRLIEIPNSEFGHGRTRNLGVQQTSGELIAFLTQDATPASEHWLAAYRDAFRLADNVGSAFGPHLPRPGNNPLMARMLIDHFAGFGSKNGEPVLQQPGDLTFLSNSNSCISRAAWERAPFRDIPYAEDQAFGVDSMNNGFSKVYVPAAGALHSHDYGMIEGFRRSFDDYRGVNDSTGEGTGVSIRDALGSVKNSVRGDLELLDELGQPAWRRATWSARSTVHHSGRVFFGGLGSHANRLPSTVRAAISLEGRDDAVRNEPASPRPYEFSPVAEVERDGVVPLTPTAGGSAQRHFAWVVPPFGVGGGGHTTIFRMVRALEAAGHRCSIWVHDPAGLDRSSAATLRKRIREHYFDLAAELHIGFTAWAGADVAIATGWDTVFKILRLDGCGERAYFVQDHEPDFYAESARAIFAQQSYGYGLHCICASPWLAERVERNYGASAESFTLGVDTDEYAPTGMPRRADTIAFYARHFTERRGVELGLMALEEVKRRRPDIHVTLYGNNRAVAAPFAHQNLGVASRARLARLYNEATVGLSLSLTNYSLIPLEMMACGLPVVELAGRACESVFGEDGSLISLSRPDVIELADRILELVEDHDLQAARSAAGLQFARENGWEKSTARVVEILERMAPRRTEPRTWASGSII
jgi:glycosyltransferase involved in cell wall biosynthesis